MPRTSALAHVLVQVEIASGYGAHYDPRKLTDIEIAAETVPAGSPSFAIAVPKSAATGEAERQGHGYAEMIVTVASGSRYTRQYVPVPLAKTPTTSNTAAVAELRQHAVRLQKLPAMKPLSAPGQLAFARPADIIPCTYTAYGSQYEGITRIGEVHVADLSGMTEDFDFQNRADSTVSVGLSGSSASGFSGVGSDSVTNSIGTDSGFTTPRATVRYVQTHMYYQEYQSNQAASCGNNSLHEIKAISDVGDSFEENTASEPQKNPYGGCNNSADPYGYATINSDGHFNQDTGTAETITDAQKWLGFTFGTTSGFSSDLIDYYHNNTSGDVYLCGTTYMPDVPILYNNTW